MAARRGEGLSITNGEKVGMGIISALGVLALVLVGMGIITI